jgi:hypothetical protein
MPFVVVWSAIAVRTSLILDRAVLIGLRGDLADIVQHLIIRTQMPLMRLVTRRTRPFKQLLDVAPFYVAG